MTNLPDTLHIISLDIFLNIKGEVCPHKLAQVEKLRLKNVLLLIDVDSIVKYNLSLKKPLFDANTELAKIVSIVTNWLRDISKKLGLSLQVEWVENMEGVKHLLPDEVINPDFTVKRTCYVISHIQNNSYSIDPANFFNPRYLVCSAGHITDTHHIFNKHKVIGNKCFNCLSYDRMDGATYCQRRLKVYSYQ